LEIYQNDIKSKAHILKYSSQKSTMLKKAFSSVKNFIRNKELPICSNCLHFIEHKSNYPYDPLPNDSQYSKCKKFGEVDIVTGIIEYDFANLCRDDNRKCGKNGSEYEDKKK
jgi:hypothetical protein